MTVKKTVEISNLKLKNMNVGVIGTSPLLTNNMSEEDEEQLLRMETKKSRIRKARDTEKEVKDAIYRTEDGKPGILASAFRRAMIDTAKSKHLFSTDIDGKLISGAVRVLGGIIPIKYSKMVTNRARGIRSGRTKSPIIIFRPEFRDWSCILNIQFDESAISADQIINLLNYAGFHTGVGDWRPQRNGIYGMFRVDESYKGK